MSGQDMRSLIDELGAQAMECRGLLADVRGATKDLRRAVREAQDARDQLADAVQAMVDSEISDHVTKGLAKYDESTRAAMDSAVQKVFGEFDKISNVLLTGNKRGRAPDGFDLRNLGGAK